VKHIGDSDDLKFSYLVHTSLDIINEKSMEYGAVPSTSCLLHSPSVMGQTMARNCPCKVTAKPSTHLLAAADSPEMYLGLLAPAEEYNMYVCVAMAAIGNPGDVC
jgi:hypothetical protein